MEVSAHVINHETVIRKRLPQGVNRIMGRKSVSRWAKVGLEPVPMLGDLRFFPVSGARERIAYEVDRLIQVSHRFGPKLNRFVDIGLPDVHGNDGGRRLGSTPRN